MKPCPFCGSSNLEFLTTSTIRLRASSLSVLCSDCGATGPSVLFSGDVLDLSTAEVAEESGWNDRAGGWQPIETAPSNKYVVVWAHGYDRPALALHVPYRSVEMDYEYALDHADYDDENDIYWEPEGWYEKSCDSCGTCNEYSGMFMNNRPTHWMPLPEPPEDAK